MAPFRRHRLRLTPVVVLAITALVAASCGKAVRPAAGPIGFVELEAHNDNGPIPSAKASLACGADDREFGTELLTVKNPAAAKVRNEWGAVLPEDKFISGTVTKVELSTGDLQFTHPFGKDLTQDIMLDKDYEPLSQILGAAAPGSTPLGALHTEIERGLVPHKGYVLEDFLPGFQPQVGDRFAASGTWIIDCAHSDFHTEIHPLKFVAFGHADTTGTIAHTFYNPYRVSQLFNPDATLANQLDSTTRFGQPDTKSFPTYLYQEILRVIGLKQPSHQGLEAHILLEANREAIPPWVICAPQGARGDLAVGYRLIARSGVTITASPDQATGCVTFTATIGADYQPAEPLRKGCFLPWEELTQQAIAATGNPDLDVLSAIESLVPQEFHSRLERDPLVDCHDPLVVKDPGEPGTEQTITTDDTQPFPFYGVIRVFRGS